MVSTTEKIPLWIDCDPGHDDACAMILATYHPALDLLGISTVYGNTSLAQTTYNALSILELIQKCHIPVFPGSAQPFCRPLVTGEFFHGANGLAGTDLMPEPSCSAMAQWNAIERMHKVLMATTKKTAWLVAIGPLTNIALLFATYPEVCDHIQGLSIMGGVIGDNFSEGSSSATAPQGTFNPFVEFNIACDPESARCVLHGYSQLINKIVLIPLDLTHQVRATECRMEELREGKNGATKLRRAFYELLKFCADSYAKHSKLKDGAPLHDPLAVAALLFDHKDTGSAICDEDGNVERWNIDVILEGFDTGRLVVSKSATGGILIPRKIDVDGFWSIFGDCMARADEATGFKAGHGISANL